MTRLWDKGTLLDERVLAYTAGEDYLLDNRLVPYDILASIAHAEMLGEQGLLAAADVERIRDALRAIGDEHARGQWRVRQGLRPRDDRDEESGNEEEYEMFHTWRWYAGSSGAKGAMRTVSGVSQCGLGS